QTPVTEGDPRPDIERFIAPGFDLSTQIPLRAGLFVIAPDDHILVLVVHHIAMDGWSLEPLAAGVAEAYRTVRLGAEPRPDTEQLQYIDYTLWQRELLGDEDDPNSVRSEERRVGKECRSGRTPEHDKEA